MLYSKVKTQNRGNLSGSIHINITHVPQVLIHLQVYFPHMLFQPIHLPNMTPYPFMEQKLISLSKVSDFSGFQGLPYNTAPSNMFNLGFNDGVGLRSPQNDPDLSINNSFSGLLPLGL
ncbi:hypothetical protein POM88_025346 [Heracleum sosnowskyi]|uniref:Uncharacterized protein n=1 Tax=Heracleum sosnowskyi TaxID=360622 RepID=A0AAD8MMU6_9APIA|nr:hypothetical protein POM88_025346 [Heracleum sosnowskyi]